MLPNHVQTTWPLTVVSRRLGHADVQTTLQLYAHVTEDADRQAAAQWQAFTAGWRLSARDDTPAGACS
jgi:integrase